MPLDRLQIEERYTYVACWPWKLNVWLIWKIFKVESSNGCQKWPKKKIQSPNSNSIVNVIKN